MTAMRKRVFAGACLAMAWVLLAVFAFGPSVCVAAQGDKPAAKAPAGGAQRYDLAGAVQLALAENFTIVAADANKQAAEEGRKAARGAFGPIIGTDYAYERRQHPITAMGIEGDKELYTWTAGLRQNVFAGFATLAAYQKAALQKDSAEASFQRARLDLIATVQLNFFNYLKAVENVRSAQDSLTRLRSQLKVTQSFHDVGLKPRLDVLQAEVDVSEAESVLLRAQNTVSIQHARLNTLLNLPQEQDVEYVGSLDYIGFSETFERCLEEAYRRRPDMVMAQKAVEISQKDKVMAESNYYPKVNAEAAWATQGNDWRAAGSKLSSTGYSAWSVGVIASWDVFEWGSTYYKAQQAGQIINKTQAEADNLRVEVAYEVKARLLDLDAAYKRIKVAKNGLESAKEAYRMAAARYESQVGASIDVLDAQAKLTLAEASLTGAQADYLISLSALYAAMGQENFDLHGAR